MTFVTKILLEVVNLLFNNQGGLRLLGWLKLFDAVFVMYPADQTFADHYTFKTRQRFIKWKPFIVGMITLPSGARTLMFAISAHVDGRDPDYDANDLRDLHARTESLKGLLRAKSTHFAGTLPGRLSHLRVRRGDCQGIEQKATVKNVVTAVEETRHTRCCPIVILGAKGYVGRKVTECLSEEKRLKVFAVDTDGVYEDGVLVADEYEGRDDPHLILNITRPEAINPYIEKMGKKTVVLNEVYPAPHPDVVASMKERGVTVYHIAGVKASVWPPFPSAYQGAVPCCAALPQENYKVLVIEL
ncbi:MAG: hypothetical protein RI935_540 [Candidatus Parcubacteria bacterium]|jgi:hypothetical protein